MSTAANVSAASKGQGAFQRLWRALRQLFLEAIGAVFAVLALVWLSAAFRAWTRDVAHWMLGLAVAVALLFVFFSVTSFRKARKL
jgi:glycerol uptake facilitator-like aquaporin